MNAAENKNKEMEIQTQDNLQNAEQEKKAPRPRSLTVLKLDWLAERIRKVNRIKAEVEAGTYKVDSKRVARSILNLDIAEDFEAAAKEMKKNSEEA